MYTGSVSRFRHPEAGLRVWGLGSSVWGSTSWVPRLPPSILPPITLGNLKGGGVVGEPMIFVVANMMVLEVCLEIWTRKY